MRDDRPALPAQLVGATRRFLANPTGIAALASLAIVVVSGVLAPGASPGALTWLRVLAVWLLVTAALGTIASVGSGGRARATASPPIVWGALLLAVIISLGFNALAVAMTVLGLILLLLTVPGAGSAAAFWTITVTVTPLWVWSAFDAWDRWLLMLVPIAAIGLVSLEHGARAGHGGGDMREIMAAWIGLLALAAVTLAAALFGGIDRSRVTSAAIAVVALAAIDLVARRGSPRQLPPVVMPAIGLVALGFGWMAAL